MNVKSTFLTIVLVLSVFIFHADGRSAGSLDPSFGGSGSVGIFANTLPVHVRIQPDGKIMTLGGYPYGDISFISRNNADGTADGTFGLNGSVVVEVYSSFESFYDFVTLSNGKYLVAGGVKDEFALFRFNSDGSRDLTFGVNGVATYQFGNGVYVPTTSMVLQADGKIIVGLNGNTGYLARFSQDGSLDTSFGFNGLATTVGNLRKLTVQQDGRILAWADGMRPRILRLMPDGELDPSFGTGGLIFPPIDYPGDLAVGVNGMVVLTGRLLDRRSSIVAYSASGVLDTSFGTNGSVILDETPGNPYSFGKASSLAIHRNGKIVVAGDQNGIFSLHQFNSNGSVDESFGANGQVVTPFTPICRFFDVTIQPDGRIVAVGDAGSVNSPQFVGLVRYIGERPEVRVSGRVVTSTGSPLRNAVVNLVDAQGIRRYATTSSFGHFEFNGVDPGSSYTVTVWSKRFRFVPRSIQPASDMSLGDLAGLD